jgi:hypothetical protein
MSLSWRHRKCSLHRRILGSIPRVATDLSLLQCVLTYFAAQRGLVYDEYSGVKWPRREADHSPYLRNRFKTGAAARPTHTSWCVQRQFNTRGTIIDSNNRPIAIAHSTNSVIFILSRGLKWSPEGSGERGHCQTLEYKSNQTSVQWSPIMKSNNRQPDHEDGGTMITRNVRNYSHNKTVTLRSWNTCPLTMGPIGWSETSVTINLRCLTCQKNGYFKCSVHKHCNYSMCVSWFQWEIWFTIH